MEKQRAGEEERERHPETERERLRERISRMVHILLIFGISVNIQSIKTTIISHIRVQASNMTSSQPCSFQNEYSILNLT